MKLTDDEMARVMDGLTKDDIAAVIWVTSDLRVDHFGKNAALVIGARVITIAMDQILIGEIRERQDTQDAESKTSKKRQKRKGGGAP